ncbi:TPA: hypothetical protein EYP66_09525 [Candidatus Poribacteria bacterium]|nr:hypothetical protein [Candidatus Poribacteria bacterium]
MKERDEILVRRVLAGDTEAFGELVDKYKGAVFAIAFHWVFVKCGVSARRQGKRSLEAGTRLDTLQHRDGRHQLGWSKGNHHRR